MRFALGEVPEEAREEIAAEQAAHGSFLHIPLKVRPCAQHSIAGTASTAMGDCARRAIGPSAQQVKAIDFRKLQMCGRDWKGSHVLRAAMSKEQQKGCHTAQDMALTTGAKTREIGAGTVDQY